MTNTLSALFVSSLLIGAAGLPAGADSRPHQSQPQQVTVAVPGGTPVVVHLASELTSSSAKEGDKFSISVVNDVRAAGWLVIPAGAQGIGEVVSVENAGGNGHAGKLGLQFDYVYAADGEKIRVSQTANSAEGEQKKGGASTAAIATYALLGPVGLFAHNWVKGREVTVSPKQQFTIYVDNTVHVQASDRQTNSDNFAK